MSEHDEQIVELREGRKAALAALNDIHEGARIMVDGVDVTDRRRQKYQDVVRHLDALIAAYEDLDFARVPEPARF